MPVLRDGVRIKRFKGDPGRSQCRFQTVQQFAGLRSHVPQDAVVKKVGVFFFFLARFRAFHFLSHKQSHFLAPELASLRRLEKMNRFLIAIPLDRFGGIGRCVPGISFDLFTRVVADTPADLHPAIIRQDSHGLRKGGIELIAHATGGGPIFRRGYSDAPS